MVSLMNPKQKSLDKMAQMKIEPSEIIEQSIPNPDSDTLFDEDVIKVEVADDIYEDFLPSVERKIFKCNGIIQNGQKYHQQHVSCGLKFFGLGDLKKHVKLDHSFPTNHVSRDERKARELNLPFAVSEIVDLPIDGFNELLSRYTLNESQLELCRNIRRRGKNKVAAQNCRNRKRDIISNLEEEVSKTRQQKQILLAEREELCRLTKEWTNKLMNLEASVLLALNRNPETYVLDYSGPSVKVTTRLAKSKAEFSLADYLKKHINRVHNS